MRRGEAAAGVVAAAFADQFTNDCSTDHPDAQGLK
jgi:hypothetical protein